MQTAGLVINILAIPKTLGEGTVLLIYLISFLDEATLCVSHPSPLQWRGEGNFHFPGVAGQDHALVWEACDMVARAMHLNEAASGM